MPDLLYVCADTEVKFRAIQEPSDAPWSAGKPVWGGASGTGDQAVKTFTQPGTNYVTAECGNVVTGTVVVVEVELELKNTGTIVEYPEYDKYHVAKDIAGDDDRLGPFPMGEGNRDHPNVVYAAAHMMIGKIEPFGLPPELEFRWHRGLSEAGWFIMKQDDEWHVFNRTWEPTPVEDSQPLLQDNIPSEETNRIYDYDNSGFRLITLDGYPTYGGGDTQVGDYMLAEVNFFYSVQYRQDSGSPWRECASAVIGQKAIAKRIDMEGEVPNDWEGIENSTAVRQFDLAITETKVRSVVGGDLPIIIHDP